MFSGLTFKRNPTPATQFPPPIEPKGEQDLDLGFHISHAQLIAEANQFPSLKERVKYLGNKIQMIMPSDKASQHHKKTVQLTQAFVNSNCTDLDRARHREDFINLCNLFGIESDFDRGFYRFKDDVALNAFFSSDRNFYRILSRMIDSLALIQGANAAVQFGFFLSEVQIKPGMTASKDHTKSVDIWKERAIEITETVKEEQKALRPDRQDFVTVHRKVINDAQRIASLEEKVQFLGDKIQMIMPSDKTSHHHNKQVQLTQEFVNSVYTDIDRKWHFQDFIALCDLFGIEIGANGDHYKFRDVAAQRDFFSADRNFYRILSRMMDSVALIQGKEKAIEFALFLAHVEPTEPRMIVSNDLKKAQLLWKAKTTEFRDPQQAEEVLADPSLFSMLRKKFSRIQTGRKERSLNEKLKSGEICIDVAFSDENRTIVREELSEILRYTKEESSLDRFYREETIAAIESMIHLLSDEGITALKKCAANARGIYTVPRTNVPVHIVEVEDEYSFRGQRRSPEEKRELIDTKSRHFAEALLFVSNFYFFKQYAAKESRDEFLKYLKGNCIDARFRSCSDNAQKLRSTLEASALKDGVLRPFETLIQEYCEAITEFFQTHPEAFRKTATRLGTDLRSKIYAHEIMRCYKDVRCLPNEHYCPAGKLKIDLIEKCLKEVILIDEEE